MSSGNGGVSDVSWELMVRGTRCYRGEYASYIYKVSLFTDSEYFQCTGWVQTQAIAFHYLEENYL